MNKPNLDKLMLAANQKHREQEYWLKELSGNLLKSYFPFDDKGEDNASFKTVNVSLDRHLFCRITEVGGGSDYTLHVILTAGLVALLYKYTGSNDIMVGSPIYKQENLEEFINTVLPLRHHPGEGTVFKDLLMEVRRSISEGIRHQNYPIELLRDRLGVDISDGRSWLFDTAILLSNIHRKEYIRDVNPLVTFAFLKTEQYLKLEVEYDSSIYKETTIRRIIDHLENFLKEALDNLDIKISRIDMLSKQERKVLLESFNFTGTGYPADKTIHQLFEEQAAAAPENIAAACMGQGEVTYRQLNEKSNQLAWVLRKKGITVDSIVGVMPDRSWQLVVAILAVLKAGGAYLPIDSDYPPDRLSFILEDSSAGLLLSQNKAMTKTGLQRDWLDLEDLERYGGNTGNPTNVNHVSDLAYIIYTSGTTGRPKGVMIPHRNVVRLLFTDTPLFDFGSSDVWTMLHSHCFDFSVWEMYGALLYGGKLVVISKQTARDPDALLEMLKAQQVTVLNQTPSAFYSLIEKELACPGKELGLKYVIFGGEALNPAKLSEWYRKYPGTKLVNMFGITETTVHVTYKQIAFREIEAGVSNIGVPIPTLRTYVVDRHMNLLPEGVPGELCVGGEGVARGYLNRPELTEDKFVKDLWDGGRRIYKSGDLVRISGGGDLEYFGRKDHQVQVRGFRVEPGEIESELMRHEAVKNVVVLPLGQEDELSLYAYIVPTFPGDLSISDLKDFLSRQLPDYMVPHYFVELEQIPLTPNGKVDRKALVKLGTVLEEEYIPPRNPREEKLTGLWAELLKKDKVGIKENFFDIGGDSIKAIRLISLINTEFNADLKVVDLYLYGTIENLAKRLEGDPGNIIRLETEKIKAEVEALKDRIMKENDLARDIEDVYPMSNIEKGIVFYYLRHPGTGLYHDQFVYPMKYRKFEFGRLKKAVALMVGKHSILRTGFNLEDYAEPVQVVHKNVVLDMEYFDVSHKDRAGQEEYIRQSLSLDLKKPFNEALPPLWRLKVFLIDETTIVAAFICHHAILDGWSVASLTTELHNIYLTLKTNPDFIPQPLEATYKDAVISESVESKNPEVLDYWEKELSDYNRLPLSEAAAIEHEYRKMEIISTHLGTESLKELRNTAKAFNTTVNRLCFGAYVYLMAMLTNEDDIVVGNVTHNRPITRDGDKILGCFLNTVPVRMQIPWGKSWVDYIRGVDDKMMEVKAYERLSLFEIARIIGEKSKDRNPIFDTLFNFKDFHIFNEAHTEEEFVESYEGAHFAVERSEDTNTLLDFEVDITGNFLRVDIKYKPLIINRRLVEKCTLYFKRIIHKFINDPNAVIRKNEIITDEEKHRVLIEFNDTGAGYSRNKTMHQLFEEQVAKTPDKTAVIDIGGVRELSYGELNDRANQLAGVLRKRGVTPGYLAAVIIDRCAEMVIAVMGILKAGGAYVPLEAYLPEERIRKIAESLKIRLVITNARQLLKVGKIARELPLLRHILCLDREFQPAGEAGEEDLFKGKHLAGPGEIGEEPVKNLTPSAGAGDISYIIFTSGSTGIPKGVVETHRPVINVVEWVNKTFEVGHPDKLLFVASLGFDLSVYDIFGILASGACLRVVSGEDIRNPRALLDIIMNEGITFWDSAPAALQQLVPFFPEVAEYSAPSQLRLVFLSGDWIPVAMPDALRETFTGVRVISLGGATEATIWSNYYPIGDVDPSWPSIPYGKPIWNAKYYILDHNMEICPIGVPGDLYIGGECLASEYKNDPGLTADKFPDNPYVPGEKIYKTGDIARWFEDGNMEFLGRKDHQVKIRGFRIELGEIESQLSKHPLISDSIVIDRKDAGGNKYLCAYYVIKSTASAEEVGKEVLKEHLAGELPEYMIPSYFIPIGTIPVTANGKLDRKALPEPQTTVSSERTYAAPGSETQEKLVSIWSEVLFGKGSVPEPIGIDDDFFELGGHSLSATQVISRIHKELGSKIPLADLFDTPTVRDLSGKIEKTRKKEFIAVKPVEKREYYVVSSAQMRMYLLQQMELNNIGYNIQEVVVLPGDLDVKRLQYAFAQLIRRHESLRTSFHMVDGNPLQKVHDQVEFEINYYYTTGDTGSVGKRELKDFVRPFDLAGAPLLRVGMFRLEEKRQLMAVDMHHIISDGVSHAILIQDFMAFYEDRELPVIGIQYKDYSQWQHSAIREKAIKKQELYWLKAFEGEIPVLDMPSDYARPAVQSYEGSACHFDIGRREKQALNELALQKKGTLFMLLVALVNVLLSKICRQEDIVIGTPVAGRGHADLERVIGMFVNTLVLRNYPYGEKSFDYFFGEVKEKTLQAFENQDYQFEDLVEKVVTHRDMSRNPLFDVMLVLQNMQVEPAAANPGAGIKPYHFESDVSRFDLTFSVWETSDRIHFKVEYCTRIFKKETVERIIGYFNRIVFSIIESPGKKILEIDLAAEEEKRLLLYDFNDTEAAYPENRTIYQLFSEQAEQMPDRIALFGGNISITYGELNKRSDALARLLRYKGIQADTIGAIMMPRSLETIIGILGILKAGGAYLPIDPEYPQERIDFILKDSGTGLLLKHLNFEFVSNFEVRASDATSSNLAYIIYTSGSTGRPKGVMIEHRSLVNLCLWHNRCYGVTREDRSAMYANIGFDASVWELFPYLIKGASSYIIPDEIKLDISKLNRYYEKNSITMGFLPTRFCEQFMEMGGDNCSLRLLLTGGDKLGAFFKKGYLLYNNYGPTENTVVSTSLPVDRNYENIPIGKPIDNNKIYILHKDTLQLQPLGVAGELCVAGAGIARGYLNRPELTAEKFLPFCGTSDMSPTVYIYKTGDLARWLPDGNIEFLGRIDYQVKIRGFRIELEEIENKLQSHNKIETAVIVTREKNGEKFICAYYAPAAGTVKSTELKEYLAQCLPDYMIPAYFVPMEVIPVTSNGKVDRRALPEPEIESIEEYVKPGTEMEKMIAEVWKDVLGLDKIGVNDRFFDIGGNSANILQVHHKLKEKIEKDIPVMKMFLNPTIYSLAEFLSSEGIGAEANEVMNHRQLDVDKTMMKQSMQKLGKSLYRQFQDEAADE